MRAASLLIGLLVILPLAAGADVTITEKVSTSGMMGMANTAGTEVTYIKGDRIRSETSISSAMMPGTDPEKLRTVIIRTDKGVMWFLSDEDSTYLETPIGKGFVPGESTEVSMKLKDIKINETDEERIIAGYKCKAVEVSMSLETGVGERAVGSEASAVLWLAKEDEVTRQLKDAWNESLEASVGKSQGDMKAFLQEMTSLLDRLDGVPLAMEMEMDMMPQQAMGKGEMEEAMKQMREFAKKRGVKMEGEEQTFGKIIIKREVVSISTEELDNNLFEIPRGYKKTETMPMPIPPVGK